MQLKKVHLFIAAGALAAAGVGLVVAIRGGSEGRKLAAAEDTTTKAPSRAQAALDRKKRNLEFRPPREQVARSVPLRDIDKDIIALVHGAAPAKDATDVLPRLSAQVDVYVMGDSDANRRIRRVDVDVDRDGRPDERWNLTDESTLERRVMAPGSEMRHFRDTYVLDGESWALRFGSGKTADLPPPDPAVIAANVARREIRPIDTRTLELARAGKSGKYDFAQPDGTRAQILVFPDRTGRGLHNVSLDTDGDGAFDETWTVTKMGVRRRVSPMDDSDYSEMYALTDGKWQRL